ncbi:dTDP-4-dehydrorhamnose reductase [Alkalihalobacillus hwajinpoensis]|uniref:dTDP-4-dehydrorhamnose reductase n=1 Tax=Guptibacillus hwajinpoensis TaxID=208199 RepID=UPI001883155F|nr:dTDP-4-dehydrorhamnose reductase [Pseudalkalibacillus hwajinpoensis]MBF0705364.1 dTDP-4-dehydrorhamnose reductase [Pseudalkalibacillus hwajinpoensis]
MMDIHEIKQAESFDQPVKKIMVLGAGGQVGKEFVRVLRTLPYEVFFYTRNELDITQYDSVLKKCKEVMPNIIVNCAAYTNVDQAEWEQELVFEVNENAVKRLAEVTREINAELVHISTNYVFDGESRVPYTEDDLPNPVNIYGRSKLAGENAIKKTLEAHYIIRTSWVYGCAGDNYFVNLLEAAKIQETIGIVDVQVSSPTYTEDLVYTVVKLMETKKFGTYHMTNSGSCSRYEFASAVLELAGKEKKLERIIPDQLMAKRPAYSVLNHEQLRRAGMAPRRWKEALSACMTAKMGDINGDQ